MGLCGCERLPKPSKFHWQLGSWLEGCQEMLVEEESAKYFVPCSQMGMGLKKAIAERGQKRSHSSVSTGL